MEDIAKEHGRQLRKGRLGADGDIEFYDDDAETKVS
jgi:protein import protein ZIM17